MQGSQQWQQHQGRHGVCLPHHGVYHPNKPGKIRMVFDLSAEYKGTCLKKELLPGPDVTN